MSKGYWVDDGNGPIFDADAASGAEAAERCIYEGYDASDIEKSMLFIVFTWQEDEYGAENRETHKVVLHPDAPVCTQEEHAWCSPHEVVGGIEQSPGVSGHGGGVIIREVCRHCGCYRVTDTWHVDSLTGQIYEAVWYEPADDASLNWLDSLD